MMVSGGFADVKFRFSGLTNQNWAAFVVGVVGDFAVTG